MATSGTYSFTVTRDDIVTMALKNIGKLDPYETPDAVDVQDCVRWLNMIVKQRMGKADGSQGLKVWSRQEGHLFLSLVTGTYLVGPTANGWVNTGAYSQTTTSVASAAGASTLTLTTPGAIAATNTIGVYQTDGSIFWAPVLTVVGSVVTLNTVTLPVGCAAGAAVIWYVAAAQQPLTIETCNLRDSVNSDVPVKILRTVQDWAAYSQRANVLNTGDPAAIFYEFKLGASTLKTDVGAAADVTKHLVISYLEPVQDFNNPLDNPEYPQEYYMALVWLLSEQAAPMFFKVWSAKMEALKKEAVEMAFGKDREVTTAYFQCGEDGLS